MRLTTFAFRACSANAIGLSGVGIALLLMATPQTSLADEAAPFLALNAQATSVTQFHPAFHAGLSGDESLDHGTRGSATNDISLFFGLRPSPGGELWLELESDQGFGLSNTLGVAGFPSGEAYKVGKNSPYERMQRWFWRQTFTLGGAPAQNAAGQMNFAQAQSPDRLVITAGKFGVTDIFDQNRFAHDSKADFLNWTVIDAAALDYAADSWGYSEGGAVELYQGRTVYRLGLFDLSRIPNGKQLDNGFDETSLMSEVEADFGAPDRPAALRLTLFANRGRMGSYEQALKLAAETGGTPSTALVRRYASRVGGAVNLEAQITEKLGLFARASLAEGDRETYEFTDVDRSLSIGLSRALRGLSSDDQLGLALVDNQASGPLKAYLRAGGLGLLIGDGALPRSGDEHILETYWRTRALAPLSLTLDYQLIDNPGYDRARGPVSVLGFRLHLQN